MNHELRTTKRPAAKSDRPFLFGGDEESRTPVRKCRPMNFSERRPCLDLKPFSYKDKLDDSSL